MGLGCINSWILMNQVDSGWIRLYQVELGYVLSIKHWPFDDVSIHSVAF